MLQYKMDTNNGYMSAIAAKRFQSKLDSLKHKTDWQGLKKMLKRYAVIYALFWLSIKPKYNIVFM
jgi:hypothetical protein